MVLKINDTSCKVMVDTGSVANILDEAMYKKIGKPQLSNSGQRRLCPYGGVQPLKVLGCCSLTVETKKKIQVHEFQVVLGDWGALLGYDTASDLGLVKVNLSAIGEAGRPDKVKQRFPNLFKGIGKLKGIQVRLHIDDSVKPVAHRHRRTPFHLRNKVAQELDKLLEEDIIERVEGEPTPWLSPIVVVPKRNKDEIRICVDMREANKAILRERHLLPTTEELISDLNGASIFSKIDLRAGYHQLELHPDSRYITTFSTHKGLFRYKRLFFGISSASEIFNEHIRNVIQDIPHAKNVSDDIFVYGKGKDAVKMHEKTLTDTLDALEKAGLTVNSSKNEYHKEEVNFYGLKFSAKGISPDPKKVSAVKDIPAPKNVSEVRSLMGMLTYCSRFIPDFATVGEPIRRLLRNNVDFVWSTEQDKALQRLKDCLSNECVLQYFDTSKETELIVDASPVGLGAMLCQENKVVEYASCSLSPTESRYSQTEREALAIVWACEHFDMYLCGAPHFVVWSDHKPLERIWKKAKAPSLRIERWGLRLQSYNMTGC